jgi:hypothetical protein
MLKNIIYILLWMLVGIPLSSISQTKGLQEVDVDLGSGSFTGSLGLPFDVPFRITGPITAGLRKVTVKYRIQKDEHRNWMRFPQKEKGKWSKPDDWVYIDDPVKDQKFRLTVGPLHPNVGYEFKYEILKIPGLNPTQYENLRVSIFESLINFLETPTELSDPNIARLNAELNKKMQVAVGSGTILNKDETPFVLDILQDPLRATTDAIIDCNLAISDAQSRINSYIDAFKRWNRHFQLLKNQLDRIVLNPAILNAAAKAIWDAPVAPLIQSVKDIKFSELAGFITDPSQHFDEVMAGNQKITKPGLAISTSPDPASFELLNAFFEIIASGKITNTANPPANFFAGMQNSFTGTFLPAVTGIQTEYDLIKEQKKIKADLLLKFPNVLADKLISLTVVLLDRSMSDAVSQSTPYIGLDLGFSFTPAYSQLFAYEGVNFYFVPVNKEASLSRMKGLLNNLSKRFSIHIGLTQSLITAENKNYQALINNVGSLLAGFGLRFSRITRLNVGTIFFYEKNPNPLIDKKDLKKMYCFSFTFDINIAKALGNFGTRIGVK